jgi:hypothetical protein
MRRFGLLAAPAWWVSVSAATAAVCTFVALAGLRGVDVPAQLFRAELFHIAGFTVWSPQWYGGHHTPLYSILFPPLAAALGLATVGSVTTIGCVVLFGRLVRGRGEVAAALAMSVFAVAMIGNLIVGRITFALGLVLAMVSVATLAQRRSPYDVIALGAAAAAGLGSPLAAASLAVVAGGWWLVERRTMVLAVAVAAVAPIAILGLLFPEGGTFPFTVSSLMFHLAGCLTVAALAGGLPVLRGAALATAAAALPLFAVANPVGGNFTRLSMLIVPAILAWLLLPRRWIAFLVLAGPILGWQIAPVVSSLHGVDDPSAQAAYHQPLVDWLGANAPADTRVEIPMTRDHWEAAYVAPHVPLARGWERQLDFKWNPLFYDDANPLTPASYREWLVENAVRYVALPDAPLDPTGEAEARLLGRDLPFLDLVWANRNWRVWEVRDPAPLVSGPARLVSIGPDEIRLDVRRPGRLLVRVHESRHMVVGDDAGCVAGGDDGWTHVYALRAGEIRIGTSVTPSRRPTCPGF